MFTYLHAYATGAFKEVIVILTLLRALQLFLQYSWVNKRDNEHVFQLSTIFSISGSSSSEDFWLNIIIDSIYLLLQGAMKFANLHNTPITSLLNILLIFNTMHTY